MSIRTKSIFIAAITIFIASTTGCKDEAKSKQWYMDHQEEMNTVYAKCKANGETSENCKNAIAAHFSIQQKNAPVADLN